ncbi:MAG TPA: M2 family metallopeptidase [Thermoplasmata archaeon]|nr:M2 family metallopeptidase [Thermoplasmata archaeon]
MVSPPAAEAAESFVRRAEGELFDLSIELQRAEWVQSTYVTEDTQALASRAYARLIQATARLVRESNGVDRPSLTPESWRKVELLRTSLPLFAPADPAENLELPAIVAEMQAIYARGRVPLAGAPAPLDLEEVSKILATVRDPARLRAAWTGWHEIARPMRSKFARYVELANRGVREVGFVDLGDLWRSKYDMAPEAFVTEVHRLWEQVAPLYRSLHAYVRRRLGEIYGPEEVPAKGPLPAHLLGNMWGQSWEHLAPILRGAPSDAGPDLTQILVARGTTARQMVEYAERFFTSIGLPALPASFWDRSMLTRPRDREVVCHASAWDLDFADDLRIKMCIDITAEDFRTIHHELGHNYYQRAYAPQPFLFRDSANDGFHEAIGDTISLSVTPEYLVRVGLFDRAPGEAADLPVLLDRALEDIAFLPFGLLVDEWRWRVFDGSIAPEEYNRTWWEYRRKYQGLAPPAERGEEEFDPGAKYHVAANVPYIRYFLASILHFQFHRALAREVDWTGPLHRCSIYGHTGAGERLASMLALGASRPWPEALEALTGEPTMDAGALLDYYAPLRRWLDEQNRGSPVGW